MIHIGIDLHFTNMVNSAINVIFVSSPGLVFAWFTAGKDSNLRCGILRRSACEFYDVDSTWQYPDKVDKWLQSWQPQVSSLEAGMLLEQIFQLQKHIRRVEQIIEEQGEFICELERFLVVPGIGLVTGWTILAEVGDILRFTVLTQVVCLAVYLCRLTT